MRGLESYIFVVLVVLCAEPASKYRCSVESEITVLSFASLRLNYWPGGSFHF